MSMTKGTPASSKIIFLEQRVTDLEIENERLEAALRDVHAAARDNHLIANIARAALDDTTRAEIERINQASMKRREERT